MSFKFALNKKLLEYKLEKAIGRGSLLSELATFMRERVYTNTKRGYYAGVKKNLAKFKPLSDGYVMMRQAALSDEVKASGKTLLGGKRSAKAKRKKALKQFGDFFNPKKANLTLTGEMLDALDSDYSTGDKTVRVFVQSSGRSDDSGLTNRDVAIKVAADGRPFLGIDTKGVNTMTRMIIASARRYLRGK
jgi:hypothetical protein